MFRTIAFLGLLALVFGCAPQSKTEKSSLPEFCAAGEPVTCENAWTKDPKLAAAAKNIEGLWLYTRSTMQRNGKDVVSQAYEMGVKMRYCFGQDGVFKAFQDKDVYCTHCYSLGQDSLGLIMLPGKAKNDFCTKQLSKGRVRIVGDSLFNVVEEEWGRTEYLYIRDLVQK